jgi:hypothetical protein
MLTTEWTSLGDEVARAVGVVVAQTGCSPSEALAVLLAAAEASGCAIDRTAVAIIERRLRFDEPNAGSMLRRRVSAQCVEVGARDSALNGAGNWTSDARH